MMLPILGFFMNHFFYKDAAQKGFRGSLRDSSQGYTPFHGQGDIEGIYEKKERSSDVAAGSAHPPAHVRVVQWCDAQRFTKRSRIERNLSMCIREPSATDQVVSMKVRSETTGLHLQ